MGSEPPRPHRQPQAVDEYASKAGLRTVAMFEAVKGLLVLVLAAALVVFHDRIEDLAEDLLYNLHVDFERRLAQAVMHGASRLSDMRIWTVLAVACSYSTVRFVEAWGLWHRRVWAEWFALLSGALYLPLEIVKVAQHGSWESITALVLNLAIVLYMLEIRIRSARARENGS